MGIDIETLIRERTFYSEFQPLWNTSTNSIFAYEAFMRTNPRLNPLEIFQMARDKGILFHLDTAAISNAVKEYPYMYLKNYLLFVNVFPSTLVHDNFLKFIKSLLANYPDIKGRIVFEINEETKEEHFWSQELFSSRLALLKSMDIKIAFDDLPRSETSFKKLLQHKPDFVKLDHTYAEHLTFSQEKQQDIMSLLDFTRKKMKVVLEGIETKEDLLTAKNLGVPLLQGYYISKPTRL